jgi:hypothetical protein
MRSDTPALPDRQSHHAFSHSAMDQPSNIRLEQFGGHIGNKRTTELLLPCIRLV